MKNSLLLCLALVLSGGLFGCSHAPDSPNLNTTASLQNIFKKIEERIPELVCIGTSAGIPGSGQVWHGEEYASGTFVLRKNMILHPAGEFPRNTNAAPYVRADISVVVTRYDSSGDVQKGLQTGLLRNQGPQPKKNYKGAVLYRWLDSTGETANMVCQTGLCVVEVTPDNRKGASPLLMKVLDVVLAELNSN